jgi:competence CoiA-like predicted nuclease
MTRSLSYTAKVNPSTGEWEGLAGRKMRREVKGMFGGKSIEIEIHEKKRHRSGQQNRLQWFYYTEISEVTGYTPSEVHEICKGLFLKAEKVNEKTGAVYEYTKSTTELSTTEHIEYTAQIKQWAAEEFEIYLPDPGEQIGAFADQD